MSKITVEKATDPEETVDDASDAEEEPSEDAGARPAAHPETRQGSSQKMITMVVIVLIVAAGLSALVLLRPDGTGGGGRHKPAPTVNDTIAALDLYISEVLPAYGATGSVNAFVEIRAGAGIADLKDWRLTTYDNDSYVFPSQPVSTDSSYITVNVMNLSTGLSLSPSDELGVYDPLGRLVDFLRWGGGNSNSTRGGWPAAEAGPSPGKGASVSRLDAGRFSPAAWSSSPPSPGEPNILEVKMGGIRQVLWVHSGRPFTAVAGLGDHSPLPPGTILSRSILVEAAGHLEYAVRQLRRLGEPQQVRTDPEGAPVLEFWITNGSSYRGITEPGGRVFLDIGDNRDINAFVCAKQMARLIELGRWGAPTESNVFIREGLATLEGLRAAASEISPSQPSIDGLWNQMKAAGLHNPFDHGLDLGIPFIFPWSPGPDQMVCSWLFVDFCERKFLNAGLGTSLSQAMLSSTKDPLVNLPEQLGQNLNALYWDWLVGRVAPGFKYPAPLVQRTAELGSLAVDGSGALQPWTAWRGRINISLSGSAELNMTNAASSAGPLQFIVISYRNGSVLAKTAVGPGQSFSILIGGLQPLDELVLVAGSSDRSGSVIFHASALPPAPSGLDPRDGNITNQSRPLFAWSNLPGVLEYELQISSDRSFSTLENRERGANNSFSPEDKLGDGRHYWRVRGWTVLGNPTPWSQVQNITVDTVPPFCAPIIGEPRYRASPDDIWNITVSTQIIFNHDSSDTVFFRFSDGDIWQKFSTGFLLSGSEGPRTVEYFSQDPAGNSQTVQTLEVRLDLLPPEMAADYGKPSYAGALGDMVNVTMATKVTLSARDNWSGVADLKYRLDGQPWKAYVGEFNFSGLTEGPHILTMTSLDRLGNGAQLMSRFFVDLTPPSFTMRNITNGTFLYGNHLIWINGSDGCGIGSVSYRVDNVPQSTAIAPPYDWLWQSSQASDDFHQVEARVQDNVGNTVSASVTVGTENDPPVTSVALGVPKYRAFPSDIWNVTWGTRFNLSCTHSFAGSGPTWYSIDGNLRNGTSFDLIGLPNGRHNITYGSRGISGINETAKCISVNLDNRAPMPMIVGPVQDETINGSVLVNVTETTNATDVFNCTLYYSTDSVNWNCIGVDTNGLDGWNVTWDTTSVSNGNYWLKAEMTDQLGNMASSMISVNVQNP
jgi:hypothetical protein